MSEPWRVLAAAVGRWERENWGTGWLRSLLREGVRPTLTSEGVQEWARRGRETGGRPRRAFGKEEEEWVECQLREGTIEELVGDPPSRVASVFCIEQGAKRRWITNLKLTTNLWTHVPSFRGVKQERIPDLIQPGDWGFTLDVRSAFKHVRIHPDCRWMFSFRAAGRLWQPVVMPFGWTGSPWVWSRVMGAVKERMVAEGIRCVVYVDDVMVLAGSRDEAAEARARVLRLFEEMGLVVAQEKLSEVAQSLTFLGYQIDLAVGSWALKPEARHEIRRLASRLLNARWTRKSILMQLLGKLQGKRMALLQLNMYTSRLYQWLRWGKWRGRGKDGWGAVPDGVKGELRYWAGMRAWQACARRVRDTARLSVESDASGKGWGVVVVDLVSGERWTSSGFWPNAWRGGHSTVTETQTVVEGLAALEQKGYKDVVVRWRSDNRAALAAMKKLRSGSRRLQPIIGRVIQLIQRTGITLRPAYIPGPLNTEADTESRDGLLKLFDFRTIPFLFNLINRARPHSIDAFATLASRKCRKFFAPTPTREALGWDAFAERWAGRGCLWMVPPWDAIPTVLARLEVEADVQATLMVPHWQTEAWFHSIWRLASEVWILPRMPTSIHPVSLKLLPAPRWRSLIVFFGGMPPDWHLRRNGAMREWQRSCRPLPDVWTPEAGWLKGV